LRTERSIADEKSAQRRPAASAASALGAGYRNKKIRTPEMRLAGRAARLTETSVLQHRAMLCDAISTRLCARRARSRRSRKLVDNARSFLYFEPAVFHVQRALWTDRFAVSNKQ
jgi:hypothetical protein